MLGEWRGWMEGLRALVWNFFLSCTKPPHHSSMSRNLATKAVLVNRRRISDFYRSQIKRLGTRMESPLNDASSGGDFVGAVRWVDLKSLEGLESRLDCTQRAWELTALERKLHGWVAGWCFDAPKGAFHRLTRVDLTRNWGILKSLTYPTQPSAQNRIRTCLNASNLDPLSLTLQPNDFLNKLSAFNCASTHNAPFSCLFYLWR